MQFFMKKKNNKEKYELAIQTLSSAWSNFLNYNKLDTLTWDNYYTKNFTQMTGAVYGKYHLKIMNGVILAILN